LKAQGLRAKVIAAVGYRSLDDQAGKREKVWKPKKSLFTIFPWFSNMEHIHSWTKSPIKTIPFLWIWGLTEREQSSLFL
jgi:hypothetical protein